VLGDRRLGHTERRGELGDGRLSLRVLLGFAGDGEDADQAGGDVLGADVGAEVADGKLLLLP
jgi:hypothetical protein